MGKLAHLTTGVEQIRRKLESAEMMEGDMGNLFDSGFEKVNKNLEKSLNSLISQANQSQSAAFSNAVQQAVLGVTQSQQIILNALSRITSQVIESSNETKQEVGKVGTGVGSASANLASQIKALAESVKRLPTQFPEQVKTDLSGIEKEIKRLQALVMAVPVPEIPKPVDPSPSIKALEKKLSNRVHEFEIERDPMNDLIKSIKVKVK